MFQELETSRLKLREIKISDAESMFSYAGNRETTKSMSWKTHTSIEMTMEYIRSIIPLYESGIFYDWAIELKSNMSMIGTCGLINVQKNLDYAEIGYIIHQDYHRKGYGYEAVSRLIEFSFLDLSLKKLYARIFPENSASICLVQKCGFSLEEKPEHFISKEHRCFGSLSFSIVNKQI